MEIDHGVLVAAGSPERIPVGIMQRRVSQLRRFSENVTAWHPFSATRRTSSAISVGSQIGGSAWGIIRPGYAPHHWSMCQSLYVRNTANPRSLSRRAGENTVRRTAERTGSSMRPQRHSHSCRGCARGCRRQPLADLRELGRLWRRTLGWPSCARVRPTFVALLALGNPMRRCRLPVG